MTESRDQTSLNLEHRIVEVEQVKSPSKWWSRLKGVSAALAMYAGIELVIALTNFIPWIQAQRTEAQLRVDYEVKHNLWFEDFTPDPERGFVFTPNRANSSFFFETDRYGFQKGEVDKDSQVVAVGDSFCYGFGVDLQQVWTRIIEKKLSMPVSNLGVFGYAPWQTNKILEHEPRPNIFKKKIILYTIYSNDLIPETSDMAEGYYERHGWAKFEASNPTVSDLAAAFNQDKGLLDKTVTATFYRLFTAPKSVALVKDSYGRDINLFYRGNEIRNEHTSEESKAIVGKNFDAAIELARNNGSVLVPIFIPSKVWSYRREFVEAFHDSDPIVNEEKLFNWAQAHFISQGVQVIDLRPSLTLALQQEQFRVYFSDGHFAPFGNHVLGTVVADYLIKHHGDLLRTPSQSALNVR